MSAPGPLGRLREGVRRSTRLDELEAPESAVSSLEVAVAENRALELPLERLVERLERDVAEVLSRRTGPGMGA